MSLAQLTARVRVPSIARWLPESVPEPGAAVRALLLVIVAAGLFGLFAPALDAGAYIILAPLALALAALILARPDIGLMLVFLTAPLETTYLDIGVRVKPQQVIGLLTMAGWALQFAVGKRHVLHNSRLSAPIALLVLTFLFSFILHSQFVSLGISLFVLQLWFIAMIYLAANFVDEPRVLRNCFWMFVAAGMFEGLLAVIQAAGFYHTVDPAASYSSILVKGRPAGTFREPDFLAPFLIGSFLLVLPFWGGKKLGAWTPAVYGVGLLLLTAGMLAMVRASWLGMFAGLAAFGWLKLREKGHVFNAGAFLKRAAGVAVAVAVIAASLSALSPTAFSAMSVRAKNMLTVVEPENPQPTRQNEMSQAWTKVKESLLTGHGVGTYSVTTSYGQGIASQNSQTRAGVVGAGTPLGLLHDQGVIGFGAFAFLFGFLLWRLLIAVKAASRERLPYIEGAFACLIGLTASACFNNLYYYGYYWLIIALAAALAEPLWSAGAQSGESPEAAR